MKLKLLVIKRFCLASAPQFLPLPSMYPSVLLHLCITYTIFPQDMKQKIFSKPHNFPPFLCLAFSA